MRSVTLVGVRLVTLAGVRRSRLVVLLVAVAFLAVKLAIAGDTFGSNDINHWTDFVDGVAAKGPVGIYGIHFEHSLYTIRRSSATSWSACTSPPKTDSR